MKKIFILIALLSTAVFADEEGMELHDDACIACHIMQHDDSFYTRPNSKMKQHFDLRSQVSRCAQNFRTGWFPDEEKSVVNYLNNKYYKFKN